MGSTWSDNVNAAISSSSVTNGITRNVCISVCSCVCGISHSEVALCNASASGDMAVQMEILKFGQLWNSEAWQKELKALIDAPVDIKKRVSPKLYLLILGMESMKELTKLDFIIPTGIE